MIVAFNVDVLKEAEELAKNKEIKIFKNNVIYKIIEDYELWLEEKREEEKIRRQLGIIRPGKIQILEGYVFRASKPAIVGVKVLSGEIKPKLTLIKEDGRFGGEINSIKSKDNFLSSAKRGDEVAIALNGVTVGRQINEGEVLYVDVPEDSFRRMKEIEIDESEKETLEEFLKIKRKENTLWGV